MEGFDIRQLFRNFFSLGLVQVINSLLQLLVIPYVITKTGVEQFGVIAVAQVIMFYFGTFADYGFNQTATRQVSLYRDNSPTLSAIFSEVFYSKILLCFIAFLLLLLLIAFIPFMQSHFLLYCMAFVFVIGQASIPSWFLQGAEKMQWLAAATLFSKLLFVGLVFLFIKGPENSSLFLFFLGMGNFLAGVVITIMIIRHWKLKLEKISTRQIFSALKEGWPITLSNISMNVIQYGNLFILRLFTNDLVAGYFGVAERIYFTMKQVLVVFSQAIYPRICQLTERGTDRLRLFFKKVFTPFFLLVLAGSAAVFVFAPYILHFFMKDYNEQAAFVLRVLCFAVPVICLNIPGTLALLAFEKRRNYFTVYVSAMLICTIANVILVRYFTVRGTLASILITELFITTTVSVFLLRILNKPSIDHASLHG